VVREGTVSWALPLASSVAVPSSVEPSLKVTVPEAAPTPLLVTEAVRRIGLSAGVGLALEASASVVSCLTTRA